MTLIDPHDELYPVIILRARYGGIYEGALWLSFYAYSGLIDECDAFGGDVECTAWWASHQNEPRIGKGASPNAALADLKARIVPGMPVLNLSDI